MTREKSIEILKRKTTIPNDGEDFDDISDAFDMAIEALSSSENPNKWIPVSERLPEEHGGYLATVKYGYVTRALWVGDAENWKGVIAWMPLPEPYQLEIPTGAEGSEE